MENAQKTFRFDCGCEIPIVNGDPQIVFEKLDLTCQKTWDIYKAGQTQSIFQLEKYLGKKYSKELKPSNIEDAANLISVIRPGCVSGDSIVMVNFGKITTNNKSFYKNITISQLFKNKKYYKKIVSVNEESGSLHHNKLIDIFYTGQKECFKLKIRRYRKNTAQSNVGSDQYQLECTADHKILTPNGWVELQDLRIGDRIASKKFATKSRRRSDTIANRHVKGIRDKNIDGTRYFQEICYKNYYERCCICGWNRANLDVNHINGNRHTNNSVENLCFMCPNCHREYSLGLIEKDQLIAFQVKNKLPLLDNIDWVTYEGCTSVGIKDTYDISMNAPHHNFICGNIIVHNCLQSVDDNNNSYTSIFCNRKNNSWVPSESNVLDKLLEKTYGINIFQETSMLICRDIAGFDGAQQMRLIKGIGKKKADVLMGLRKEFLDGCSKIGKVSKEEAIKIFDNIEASSRYSFNKAHAVGYAITGYWTAWVKAHLPHHYICAWLRNAKKEQKPLEEIRAMISESRRLGIDVLPPSITNLPATNFFIADNNVYFGIDSIKGCGQKGVEKLVNLNADFTNCTWLEFLVNYSDCVNKTQFVNMIRTGCFDCLDSPRTLCEFEYDQWALLTSKEKEKAKELFNEDTPFTLDKLMDKLISKVSAKRKVIIQSIIDSLLNPPSSLMDSIDNIVKHEKELMGINVSCSKISKATIPDARHTCGEVDKLNSKVIILVGEISECREIKIKNGKMAGQLMASFVIADDTGQCDCVIFPKELDFYQGAVYDGNIIMIEGSKSNRGGIIINKLYEV